MCTPVLWEHRHVSDQNPNIGRQFSVNIPREDMDFYRQVADHSRLQASLEHAMETHPVDLSDEAALRAHLVSGHLQHPDHFYRDDYNADHPHMDPIDWDAADERGGMPPMSHRDLLALHADDHAEHQDPHTTMGTDHFHH